MRRLYYPETVTDWEINLLQTGGALPVYSGLAYQRGQGLGSIFRGIFRAIWPTIKKVGISAGKEALQAGSEAARDHYNQGVDAKTALKRRGKQALGRTISYLGQELQKGEGLGKRQRTKNIKGLKQRKKTNLRKSKKRARFDIFGNG